MQVLFLYKAKDGDRVFISDKFIFNGIHSDEMGVALISFNTNILNEHGLKFNRGVSLSKNNIDMSHFISKEDTIEEIELDIALIDNLYTPISWEDETLIHVIDWLTTDSFVEFISEDNVELTYFFKTTKITKYFNHKKQGYLKVTLQPFSNYAYKKFSKKYTFDSPSSFTIFNPSNLKNMYKPIIEIKNLGDSSNVITIENESIDKEPFIVQGIKENEVVTIDNLLGTVYNEDKENLLVNCNRKWINLKNGKNTINVSGNLEINIKCQFPVMV